MPATGQKWGLWTYDAQLQTLTITIGAMDYEIPVDEIKQSPTSELPDWLAQLADKTWMTPEHMGNFVYALNEIIGLRSLIRQ